MFVLFRFFFRFVFGIDFWLFFGSMLGSFWEACSVIFGIDVLMIFECRSKSSPRAAKSGPKRPNGGQKWTKSGLRAAKSGQKQSKSGQKRSTRGFLKQIYVKKIKRTNIRTRTFLHYEKCLNKHTKRLR